MEAPLAPMRIEMSLRAICPSRYMVALTATALMAWDFRSLASVETMLLARTTPKAAERR